MLWILRERPNRSAVNPQMPEGSTRFATGDAALEGCEPAVWFSVLAWLKSEGRERASASICPRSPLAPRPLVLAPLTNSAMLRRASRRAFARSSSLCTSAIVACRASRFLPDAVSSFWRADWSSVCSSRTSLSNLSDNCKSDWYWEDTAP